MKILIGKELRENLKVAALGLLVLVMLMAMLWRSYTMMMNEAALGAVTLELNVHRLQPLESGMLQMGLAWLCALFGAALGWMQIHSERHGDLWAFLVHRPTTRTEIFLAKIIAGLGIYAVVTCLPLACFIAWGRMPGHIAAPFEWPRVLHVFAFVLGGVAFYFAGLLTSLRQARWYASRGLALGMAFLVMMAAVVPTWRRWQILLAMCLGIAVLACAVWGAFHSHGGYEGQPAPGKLALTASLTLGSMVVVFFACVLLGNVIPISPLFQSDIRSYFVMTKDGTIYKQTMGGGRPTTVADLSGAPLKDGKTGRAIDPAEFSRRVCSPIHISLKPGRERSRMSNWIFSSTYWQATPETVWYYWGRYGRLVAYDLATRRCIGSLGPDGFARNLSGSGERFNSPTTTRTLRTATSVYRIDLQNRTATALFTATNGDAILGLVDRRLSNGHDWDHTVVVTKKAVCLLTPEGKVVWNTSYEWPANTDELKVYVLDQPGQFALWIFPSYHSNKLAGWTLPTHVSWIDSERGVVNRTDLPCLYKPTEPYPLRARLMSTLMPPALWVSIPMFNEVDSPVDLPWTLVFISLAAAAVLWVPPGWWLTRRYHFTLGTQLGWAVFLWFCGLPGFLAFLSVQEWPARESCPNCRKLRVINRQHCEHCGAPFAPPQPTGTEIFAPLETS